jgi:hypothetical protein
LFLSLIESKNIGLFFRKKYRIATLQEQTKHRTNQSAATFIADEPFLDQVGDPEHDGEARHGRRPETRDPDAEPPGDFEGPSHADVAHKPLHPGPPGGLHVGDEPLQVIRHVARVGVDELVEVLAVLVVGKAVRDGRQVDAAAQRRRGTPAAPRPPARGPPRC